MSPGSVALRRTCVGLSSVTKMEKRGKVWKANFAPKTCSKILSLFSPISCSSQVDRSSRARRSPDAFLTSLWRRVQVRVRWERRAEQRRNQQFKTVPPQNAVATQSAAKRCPSVRGESLPPNLCENQLISQTEPCTFPWLLYLSIPVAIVDCKTLEHFLENT